MRCMVTSIFSHFIGCFSSVVSFAVQKLLSDNSFKSLFSLLLLCFWCHNWEIISALLQLKIYYNATLILKIWIITFHDFKTDWKATVFKVVWFWHKNTHINLCSKTENPEMKSYVCDQRILTRMSSPFKGVKDVFFKNEVKTSGWSHAKEWSWILLHTIYKF